MRRIIISNPAMLLSTAIVVAALGVQARAQFQLQPVAVQMQKVVNTAASTAAKLDPILRQASTASGARSRVIVRATDSASLPTVSALIQQSGGIVGRQLSLIEAVAADVPNTALSNLAASAAVSRIASDRPTFATNERTGPTVGATDVRQNFGYDGTGIGVAVIDSGITPAHADMTDGSGTQRVEQFVDFVNGQTDPYDDYGHGTHVAGTIAGNGFDSGGLRAGIAPGARLVVLKVLDGSGQGRISNLIAAFDYALLFKDQYAIRVINVSIGAGVYESYDVDFLTVAAKRLVDAGIVVVAAAGNNGMSGGTTQYGGIAAPGNAPWVVTVGASSHNGTTSRADDTVAAFSSRGPTAVDYVAKPDVVAPGVGIESLSSPGSTLYSTRSAGLLAGTIDPGYYPYLSLSGTSQATPVVSGSIALMLQANPQLSPNAVKAILEYTAEIYPGYDALTQGAGFLNTLGAVTLAQYFASPSLLYPAADNWSRQIIWGNHRLTGGYVTPAANAWSAGVQWGAAMAGSSNVSWGTRFNYGLQNFGWSVWGTTCADVLCRQVTWGSPDSENVVWGTSCGGADCQSGTPWSSPGGAGMMLWRVGDGETIVWGTSDGDSDTIVWGTTCSPACTH